MRVLVTGAAGYIGSVLCEHLLQRGHSVIALDTFWYERNSLARLARYPDFELHVGDFRDTSLTPGLLQRVDAVIPLAALVGAPACARDPFTARDVNCTGAKRFLDSVAPGQLILMPTSNSAYGTGGSDHFCDESSDLHPISQYAVEKVEVENHLMARANAVSFRLATVYGMSPRMRLDLLVNNLVHKALFEGSVVLYESHFSRNYLHIQDACQAFELALESPETFVSQVFNVGDTSANMTKLQLCNKIREQLPDFAVLEYELASDPDQRNYLVSNKKIEAAGFTPRVSLSTGIGELICGLAPFRDSFFKNA